MILDETWRPVPGYEGRYEVSDHGRVRSLPRPRTTGGILKQRLNTGGYPIVNLYLHGDRKVIVSHIVAAAFLGPRPNGFQVRHLNGDRLDSRLSNLAYGTPSRNILDSVDHGTHRWARQMACPSGHPYTEGNIRRIPSRPRARYCRECERLRGKGRGAVA